MSKNIICNNTINIIWNAILLISFLCFFLTTSLMGTATKFTKDYLSPLGSLLRPHRFSHSHTFQPLLKKNGYTSDRTFHQKKPLENVFLEKQSDESSRKLILVSLDWTRPKDPPLALGHASILANLHHHQIKVASQSWAVNAPSFSRDTVTDYIMEHSSSKTDVALGAFVWNERAIQLILDDLKRNEFPGRIILGGPQVSYVKKGLEKFYPQADVFIRGYAENALVNLLQTKQSGPPFPIKGIHYAGHSDLGISASVELDELPSPFLTGLIQPQRFIRWEAQRGCPFRCSFCQHRESDITMKRRQFSLSRIMQEVEWIARNPVIQDVAVLDPTFNSGPHYLSLMDKLISEKFSGKISLQCRIEMVKEEFLDKICQLNKTGQVILEFGLQTIHPHEQAIIDRPSNMKHIGNILNKVRQYNIRSEVSLIFGLPKQTVASFKQSIDFCQSHQIPVIHAFPLMLLRGTPLYEQKQQLGLVESNEVASSMIDRVQTDIPHVVSSPSFTREDWKEMARIAENLSCLSSKKEDDIS